MKVKTGIEGLDELVDGGLPRGSLNLVSGECGVGKSILAMQYLVRGVEEYGEPGVFVSLGRDTEVVSDEMRRFGWHIARYRQGGSLRMIGGSLDELTSLGEEAEAGPQDLIDEMVEVVEEVEAERLAVDGLGQFFMFFSDENSYRKSLSNLGRRLREQGCTSIVTTEAGGGGSLSRSGIDEYVADGVIVLHPPEPSGAGRELEIKKLRGSDHSNPPCAFEITGSGIEVVESE